MRKGQIVGRSGMSGDELSSLAWWVAMAVALAGLAALSGGVPARARAADKAPTAVAPAVAAAPVDFFTSFEDGQPQPTWTDTPETDRSGHAKTANVNGTVPVSIIPGNVTGKVVAVQARGENPPGEAKEKAVDGNVQTKWLDFNPTSWLQVKLSAPVKVVDYALTSANDSPGRDPQDWNLQGSSDGQSWTTLDTQSGQDFGDRFETKEYRFSNDTAYQYYRLNVTANHGDSIVQLAELQLSTGGSPATPPPTMRAFVDNGPTGGPNIKANAGWTGMKALHFGGAHDGDGRAYSYDKVFDVDVRVTKHTHLSYKLFPQLTNGDLQYPSTYSAVDLAFSDGTYLSRLEASDQHFYTLSPQAQGASKSLYADQWNDTDADIGAVAAGKTIKRIIVGYDNPGGDHTTRFNGWIDDLRIAEGPEQPTSRSHLSDWAITTRGTNSSGSFSRGNNFPATAVPHGFNFLTPMTDAGSASWVYSYQAQNDALNLPELQAFEINHEPSPWMGDRQTFEFMPSAASGVPNADRQTRALPFSHDDEIARPYLYAVTFKNGLHAEMTPTDHAAVMRFTFPQGSDANVIFDNVDSRAALAIDQAGDSISGWSDVGQGNGSTRMYLYGTFDQPMSQSGMLTSGNRPSTGYAKFTAGRDRTVTMRVATSLISVGQAKHNLALEVGNQSFDSLRDQARSAWDRKLDAITVRGANADQLTTLYSNLYRLNLYPNSAYENTGTNAAPTYVHAVQSSTTSPQSSPTQTGAKVVPGKVYVNNGFWDTYRTEWRADSLLYPRDAGEMVDGFVQQYRDGGWISRWSSPGYANEMTGTSSDVAFADAYVNGVRGFNAKQAYDAAVENATVAPPGNDPFNPAVGRKGLIESEFLGYTPNRVGEGLSWSLEGDINDFGIANLAAALAKAPGTSRAERERYREESTYFLNRAQDYVNLFDKDLNPPGGGPAGFFQGKSESGQWTTPADQYDPRVWRQGGDYTETDGWNFAFHAPQDGQGLADLYGGRDQLAAKLDTFFATPETAKFPGTYGGTIHEMLEARDVRMGQWGASNQVSHHIPYMYDYAGRPWKAQAIVREATRRLFTGSTIGEGYPGDEDNGEMSAWDIFSSLGIYPLQMGSAYYVIGSPLFRHATVRMQNGKTLVIDAPHNSPDNVYVQGVKVNGRSYAKSYLRANQIANGGRIEFVMGSRPSSWATGRHAVPPSITQGDAAPHPLQDAARPDQGVPVASPGADASALFDNTSQSQTTLTGTEPFAGFDFDAPREAAFYTLTSGHGTDAGTIPGPPENPPAQWTLKASDDGRTWTVLDQRSGETFPWRQQTRAFEIKHPGAYTHYRIEFTGGRDVTLSEVELLSSRPIPANPVSADVSSTVARAGTTAPVKVTVHNAGTSPLSGTVTAQTADGWAVSPSSASFGPIAAGGAQTVTLGVAVPANTEPGSEPVKVTASTPQGVARVTGAIQVIGDTIEFTPGSDAETPWLSDPDGSQLTNVNGTEGRYADGGAHYTYRFDLPSDVTGATMTLQIGNEYVVDVSSDGQSWTTAARESREIHDLSNLGNPPQTIDLGSLLARSHTIYVRVSDSKPDDGWGGWLADLKLTMTS